jgi:hypothetical protein
MHWQTSSAICAQTKGFAAETLNNRNVTNLEPTHWETSGIHMKTKGFVAEFRTITMLSINSVSCNHKLQMHWQTSFGTHEKTKGFVAEFRTITMSSLQNLLKLLKKISVVMMNHTFFSTFVHSET